MMTARACLDSDQSFGQSGKERDDLGATEPPAQHASSLSIGAMHLKYVLGDIETDHGGIGHVTPFGLPPRSWSIPRAAATGWGGPCHHVRGNFFDVQAATGLPIAKQALDRSGQLYRIEGTINGVLPDDQRRERQQRSRPIAAVLQAWAEEIARKLLRKS